MSRVEFEGCTAIADTDEAVLVEIPDADEEVWLPKSQIDDDSEVYKKGTDGRLIIPEWLAVKKGLV